MRKNICLLTGVQFDTNNEKDFFSPVAKEALLQLFKTNEELKKEVVSEIVQDDNLIEQLAVAVMASPATSVGLNTAGTISEFFRGLRNKPPSKTT